MGLSKKFELEKYHTSFYNELLAGVTTFFTMSYIIFVNPAIMAETGMPYEGAFAATVIATVIGTLLMALVANVPYAMAPGMGTNSFVTYTICLGLNYHWREAMAIVFLSGVIHFVLNITGFRRPFVNAIPKSFKYATASGIGLFISYIGIKNAGLLSFIINNGQYTWLNSGLIIGNSSAVPSLVGVFSQTQLIAVIGLMVIIFLMTLEKKTGESYSALLMGILVATFVGVPLNVTNISEVTPINLSPLLGIKDVAFSFFGNPGLLSLFESPSKILTSILMISIVTLTCVVDSVSTIIGISQEEHPIFDEEDYDRFANTKGITSRLDKTLVVDSTSGIISSLTGTTTTVTYIESVAGISSGGRTGLTALVVAVLFLICLPFSGFFAIIPSAAIAPALIVAGIYLIPMLKNVDWSELEDAVSASLVILFIPLTNSIINGVAIGYIAYILICLTLGKHHKIHPFLYVISAVFIAVISLRAFINI